MVESKEKTIGKQFFERFFQERSEITLLAQLPCTVSRFSRPSVADSRAWLYLNTQQTRRRATAMQYLPPPYARQRALFRKSVSGKRKRREQNKAHRRSCKNRCESSLEKDGIYNMSIIMKNQVISYSWHTLIIHIHAYSTFLKL